MMFVLLRIQKITAYNGVPSEDIRDQLKYNAFRWSRYNKCWQSYLNRRQISRAKELLSTIEQS